MIDPTRLNAVESLPAATRPRPVFRMVENDRMAGGVPVWDSRATAAAPETAAQPGSFSDALSYASQDVPGAPPVAADTEPFGFFDLLDMVNPLQHIPVVSSLYRNITGDDIKPVARIIGGTVFGGPAGGAASLVNVIIEEETGKDIAGNVIAMVQGDAPQWRSIPDQPEQRLNNAIAQAEREALGDLPPAALAYADRSAAAYTRTGYSASTEDDRMAGTRPRFQSADDDNRFYYATHNVHNNLAAALPPREPITRLDIASLPVIYWEEG